MLKIFCLAIFAFWSLAPIALVVASSFKPAKLIFEVPPQWLFQPTLDNFRLLFTQWPGFFRCLANSLVIALGATLLALLASGLAGYAYARYRSRLLSASAFFMVFIRMFPPI